MSTEKQENFPRWPPLFTERRQFNRAAENQPYIDFLETRRFEGEEDEDDDEDEDDESIGEEDEDESDEDDDVSSEHENMIEGDRKTRVDKDENQNDDKDVKACIEQKKVRLFMTGMTGDEDALQYRDQVEEVASICEQANLGETGTETGQARKHVALLDDRNILGIFPANKGTSPPGNCRPYVGPLTAPRLNEKLSRNRFRIVSEQSNSTNAFEDEENDAERRVLFVTDLDPSTIEVLVMTAPRSQAPALKDLFYKHLTRKTAIGVTIPSQGFAVFTLDFHIPYYVLRVGKELLKDTRKKSNGEPLRQSWELPFLSTPTRTSTSTEGLHCLYEAQISVAVTGIDHWVWTAYGFVDAYFDSKETVDGYDQLSGRRCRRRGRADPLAAGRIVADEPIWTPREYFLKVLEIRMNQVLREWNWIVDTVEKEVQQSRTHHIFTLSSGDPKTIQQVREFSLWNTQMVKLLRQLIKGLSDTVEAWDQFQQREIGYFHSYSDLPTASPSLTSSLTAVEKTFGKLKALRTTLQNLRTELCEENPQGLNAHLSLENHEAAITQQRATWYIRAFTIVTILFIPPALASNLFSTQGILPGEPNITYFAYVVFILTTLVAATLAVLLKWDLLWQLMITLRDCVLACVRRMIIYCREEPSGGEIRRDMSTSLVALKKGLIPKRMRHADLAERLDLESGRSDPI